MKKLHIRKDDTVVILSGKDKGKQGKVLEASPDEQKVIVEGVNMVTKHVKPRRAGEQGGIIKVEGPLYACKAMVVCPSCNKPTRLAHKIMADGTKTRACKKCNATF